MEEVCLGDKMQQREGLTDDWKKERLHKGRKQGRKERRQRTSEDKKQRRCRKQKRNNAQNKVAKYLRLLPCQCSRK